MLFFPDSQYQNDIVSIEQRLGHALGERISAPAEILSYFETLASSYPERIKLVKYGESWQGRPLFYAVIGSADNLAKLDRLESDMRRLADPRNLNKASADALINSLPASVWLAGGVPVVCLRCACGVPAVCLWCARGAPVVRRWLGGGVAVDWLWLGRGLTKACLWHGCGCGLAITVTCLAPKGGATLVWR